MKNLYKRKAWLLDDGLLLTGYVAKREFIPNDKGCGFGGQMIRKKDIGRIVFFDEAQVLKLGFEIIP